MIFIATLVLNCSLNPKPFLTVLNLVLREEYGRIFKVVHLVEAQHDLVVLVEIIPSTRRQHLLVFHLLI